MKTLTDFGILTFPDSPKVPKLNGRPDVMFITITFVARGAEDFSD